MKTRTNSMSVALVVLVAVLLPAGIGSPSAASADEAQEKPWPVEVENFQPPQPGEHPRLLFRRDDLPRLRQRAQTSEGKQILERLREILGIDEDGEVEFDKETYTISHVAGFGLLYQITGQHRYADMGRRAMELALDEEWRDQDDRYSFRDPSGALRAGPSLGWYALGYDLCYDGWDEDFRNRVAREIERYNEGRQRSLAELVRGARLHPRSNHWGMQVGGGAMALLAIRNDPGVEDHERIEELLERSRKAMIRNMTEGFGDGLYFAEGDGTATMASHIIFLPALQGWKTAAGKDFITPKPNAQWMSMRWLLGTVVRDGRPHFHSRDGYPHNVWQRSGISGGGYFAIGFGVATPPQRTAWRWFYDRFFKQHDLEAETPFDTVSHLPHHTVLAFVNWPFDIEPVNPIEAVPPAAVDRQYGYATFRNRWQDENDIVVTVLTKRPRGHTSSEEIGPVWITANAADERFQLRDRHATTGLRERPDASWGRMEGDIEHFEVRQDASAVLATDDGTCLALDFSGNAGVEGMLVMIGPGAPDDGVTETADGTTYSFLFLTEDDAPTPRVQGDRVVVGDQEVWVEDGVIRLKHIAEPWSGPSEEALDAVRRAERGRQRPEARPQQQPQQEPDEDADNRPAGDDEAAARSLVQLAKNLHAAGLTESAGNRLSECIERYPDTEAASTAEELYEQWGLSDD